MKNEGWEIVTVGDWGDVTPLRETEVPEILHPPGGRLLPVQVKVTAVGVFLRTRVGEGAKVTMVGGVSVQVLLPELYVYPLFATQLGYVPGQLAGQTGFCRQVLLNEL